MRIAVTGGAGFIGTRLVEELIADGHGVSILDLEVSQRFPERTRQLDITDREALLPALAGADAIVHLAAEHRDDVSPTRKYYDVNRGGTEAVIEGAEKWGIDTIIFTSTVAVYGLEAGEATEDTPPSPFNDYGRSKLEAEHVLRAWAAADPRRRLVILRLVVVFGEGNRGNVFTLMDQIHRRRFLMIGDGRNRKSIAYVGNVTAFMRRCLELPAGVHTLNYADKPDLAVEELVAIIRGELGINGRLPRLPWAIGMAGGIVMDGLAGVIGRTFPISRVRVEKFCADTVVNADRGRSIGFAPTFTLREGLARMLRHDFRG